MSNDIDKYEYHITYSQEDAAYIGTVAEFPYLSADGPTPADAYSEIRALVEEAVDILRKEGKEIPLPFSEREFKGNISLRLSPETHRMAMIRAQQEGCSLNQFLTSLIERNLYSNSIIAAVEQLSKTVANFTPLAEAFAEQKYQQSPIFPKINRSIFPESAGYNRANVATTQMENEHDSLNIGAEA